MTLGTLAGHVPAGTTPCFVLTIPAPAAWLSSNHRTDLRAETGDRQAWRGASRIYAHHAHLPRRLPAVRIIAVCHRTDQRRSDVGNLYPTAKALVDGLVDYGLIEDDDDTRLIGPDMRRGPAVAKRTHPLGLLVVRIIPLPERIEIGSATW